MGAYKRPSKDSPYYISPRNNYRYTNLARHYYDCGNKREACRRAGFEPSYANQVFRKPQVIHEMERLKKKMDAKFELNAEWITQRLMRMAEAGLTLAKFKKVDTDGQLYWDFTGATPEELSVITSLTTDTYVEGRGKNGQVVKKFKIGITDPKMALDSLARIQGLFKDKTEITAEAELVDALLEGRRRVAAAKKNGEGDSEDADEG